MISEEEDCESDRKKMEKKGLTAAVTGRTDINYHHCCRQRSTYLELEKARTQEKWGLEPELLGRQEEVQN